MSRKIIDRLEAAQQKLERIKNIAKAFDAGVMNAADTGREGDVLDMALTAFDVIVDECEDD